MGSPEEGEAREEAREEERRDHGVGDSFPSPPEGYVETARQIIGQGDSLLDPQVDPRDFHLPRGSYTPFAKGLMRSMAANGGRAAKPVAMRVGEGELDMRPPPRQVPRNQRKFIMVGAMAKGARPPPRRKQEEATLDGFLLLDACHVEDPDDAVQAVLEGCGITRAIASDLAFFTHLTHLDVGDNALQLESLASLPNLQELHIDCNGISSIELPAGGFPRLEVLNLSYNGLRAEDVSSLAQLACLRDLDLTGNQLSRLPADWSDFLELRRLVLDRNSIRSDDALIALATTPYLKELSLALNRLRSIPPLAVENGGFGELERLDLSQNAVEHEDALVPVLQMHRLRALSVWGNPFVQGSVPQAFEEVLTDRAVSLTVSQPVPPPKPPSYEHHAVRSLDAVVHSHRQAEIAMRRAARAPPRTEPLRRENPHVAQARAQLAREAAHTAVSEVGSGGFFVTQAGELRAGGGWRGAHAAEDEGSDDELDGARQRARAPAPSLRELQDALLISDEAESLIDSNIDVRTAVNALKYALEHPLVEYDPNAPTHHQKTTSSFEASRRSKYVRPRDPLNLALRAEKAANGGAAAGGRQAGSGGLARHAAMERGIDGVPPRLDALKRSLKVAEVTAASKMPAVSEQGVASMQAMLAALQKHEAG